MVYQTDTRLHGAHPLRPADLPAELLQEIDEHFLGLQRGQEPQAQCLWFDAERNACRHYQFRPQVCRDYELAGSACLNLRAEYCRTSNQ